MKRARKDVDPERNIITLNETDKHGTPRQFKVTAQLIAMINALKSESETYLFHNPEKTCWANQLCQGLRAR